MEIKEQYKDQIKIYKSRLVLTVGLTLMFVGLVVVILGRWYQEGNKSQMEGGGVKLKTEGFNNLWGNLKKKTVPVELESEIRYGGEGGK